MTKPASIGTILVALIAFRYPAPALPCDWRLTEQRMLMGIHFGTIATWIVSLRMRRAAAGNEDGETHRDASL